MNKIKLLAFLFALIPSLLFSQKAAIDSVGNTEPVKKVNKVIIQTINYNNSFKAIF